MATSTVVVVKDLGPLCSGDCVTFVKEIWYINARRSFYEALSVSAVNLRRAVLQKVILWAEYKWYKLLIDISS